MKPGTSKSSEAGSMLLLFSVMVLPLLFFGFTLSVDLSSFYNEINHVQKLLDEAALQGYRNLPYKSEAEDAARNYLKKHYPSKFTDPTPVSVGTDSDRMTLSYSGTHELFFPRLFLSLLGSGGESAALTLNVLSKVRGTPFDVFIALDVSGHYLAPSLTSLNPWGTASSWPAAQFFVTHPVYSTSGPVPPRILTQQCWNEPLLALKAGATRAYEYFASFDSDQVGVGVYPGAASELGLLRSVRTRGSSTASPSGALSEGDIENYIAIGRRDSLCAAASETELQSLHYRFPLAPPKLTSWIPPSGSPPQSMVIPPSFTLNPEYRDFMQMRQALWASVVRDGPPASFDRVLTQALSKLFQAPTLNERGTLKGSASKVLFLFAGDLPWVNGERWSAGSPADAALNTALTALKANLLSNFQNEDFELTVYYLLFSHQGQSTAVAPHLEALQSRLNTLRAEGEKKIRVLVHGVHSGAALTNQLLPLLLVNQRSAFIAG